MSNFFVCHKYLTIIILSFTETFHDIFVTTFSNLFAVEILYVGKVRKVENISEVLSNKELVMKIAVCEISSGPMVSNLWFGPVKDFLWPLLVYM